MNRRTFVAALAASVLVAALPEEGEDTVPPP